MQSFGGISNCFSQLIKHLPKDVQYDIAIRESNNIHLIENRLVQVEPMVHGEETFLPSVNFRGKGFLYEKYSELFYNSTSLGRNLRCSIDALKRNEFDVFHPTFFDDYFLKYLKNKPFVLTIHDMIPELFGGRRNIQIRNKPSLVSKSSHIIAVSERTKQDLIDILHVPEKKVTVIYHGAPDFFDYSDEKPVFEGKYILFVGRRGGYKNFNLMIKKMAPLFKRHKEFNLVCTGGDFEKCEVDLFKELGIRDRIFLLHPSDHELMNLYTNAFCFIFPSLYEGFGIPILEAYKANCPVLLNKKSCFPEIAQDGAIYFQLDDEQSDLELVLEKMLKMPQEVREKLLKKQMERLKTFSWEMSSKKLMKVYASVI